MTQQVDVRVIATTNRNLEEAVAATGRGHREPGETAGGRVATGKRSAPGLLPAVPGTPQVWPSSTPFIASCPSLPLLASDL